MARTEPAARMTLKPSVNVYTGLAALSCFATLGALIYAVMQYLKATG